MFFQVAEAPQLQRRITYGNQGEDEVGRRRQGGGKKCVESIKKGFAG